jgi:hypothetical protein
MDQFINLCTFPDGVLNCPGGLTQFVGTLIVWLVIALGAWLAAWIAWRLLRVIFWPKPTTKPLTLNRLRGMLGDITELDETQDFSSTRFEQWLDGRIKKVAPYNNDCTAMLRGVKFWTREELIDMIDERQRPVPTEGQVRNKVLDVLKEQGLLREVPGNKVHFNVTEQHGSVRTDRPWATAQDAPARTPDVNSFG